MNKDTTELIRNKLNADAEGICRKLLGNGKKVGNNWIVGDVHNAAGDSMKVDLSKCLWYDHAEGIGGDMLSLIWKAKGLKSFSEAKGEAGRMVGITNIQQFTNKKPKGFCRKALCLVEGEVLKNMKERGLTQETLTEYKVFNHNRKSPFNEHFVGYGYKTPDGDNAFLKSTGINRTQNGKKDIWISPDSWLTLWGWWTVKPHHTEICITEGEEDAMSLRQMLGLNDIPVLSLPNGTGNLTFLEHDFTALEQFKRINMFLDCDGAGENGAKKLAERLGSSRCYRVLLPDDYKDCNEVLVKAPESTHTPLQWIKKAKTYDPPTISTGENLLNDTLEMRRERRNFEAAGNWVFDVPFEPLPGECSLLHGYVGHGKSDASYQMALNDLNAGKKVLYVSFEIPSTEVMENMCQQWCGRFPKDDDIRSFHAWHEGRLMCIDNEGDNVTWKNLQGDIIYAVRRFNVTMCYIDSMSFLTMKNDLAAQDETAKQVKKLAAMLRPLHIFMLAHSTYKEGGEYVMAKMDGVEGSNGQVKPFQNVFTWHRNAKKEEVLEAGVTHEDYNKMVHEPDARLKCWKQRNGHRKRFCKDFWFDFDSRGFREEEYGKVNAIRIADPIREEQKKISLDEAIETMVDGVMF